MKNYEKNREHMACGDVIAFAGKGRVSRLIQWKTQSVYSHVGMVLDADMQGGVGKAVLMVESTALRTLPDMASGKFVKGVQMHFLSHRLGAYDGQAWWLPLKEKLPIHAAYNMQKWLRTMHHHQVRYDTLQAMGAGCDLFDWMPGLQMEPDFSSLFCSELVCKALQIAGVVEDELNASEQTPADVVGYGCFRVPVPIV